MNRTQPPSWKTVAATFACVACTACGTQAAGVEERDASGERSEAGSATGPRLQYYVEWELTSLPQATTPTRPGADVHVLRVPTGCWFDPDDDAYGGDRLTVDWGEPTNPDDDLQRTLRDAAPWPDPFEHGQVESLPSGQVWTIAVDLRGLRTDETYSLSAEIRLDDERVFERTAPAVPGTWWVIGTVSAETGFTLVDQVSTDPSPCDRTLCDDGRSPRLEVCNGIDDDCDGVIDQSPDACLHDSFDYAEGPCVATEAGGFTCR